MEIVLDMEKTSRFLEAAEDPPASAFVCQECSFSCGQCSFDLRTP